MYSSSFQSIGQNPSGPDYLYYNADIISNNTDNVGTQSGLALRDPQIVFNETRDSALIRDASQYYFSIVRFTMNGPNKDLPLFIPSIQEGTGQTNENLTVYSMSVGFEQSFITGSPPTQTTTTVVAVPQTRFIEYVPDTQNKTLAPTPTSLAVLGFAGQYSNSVAYQVGAYVTTSPQDPIKQNYPDGPFYSLLPQNQWSPTSAYVAGSAVQYQNSFFYTPTSIPASLTSNPNPTGLGSTWIAGTPVSPSPFAFSNPANSPYWTLVTSDEGNAQDVSTRYYWVYSFQHWVDLWNLTMFNPAALTASASSSTRPTSICAYQDTYYAFYDAWVLNPAPAVTFPYPTFQDFVNSVYPPQMVFNKGEFTFTIFADTNGFGPQQIVPYALASTPSAQRPFARLFFNTNMFGLFNNYDNTFFNTPTAAGQVSTNPLLYQGYAIPDGYVNEILFPNKFYQNLVDFRNSPYSVGTPPSGYVTGQALGSKVFVKAEQDFSSVDSLWSPISSIVFTSGLLPVKSEATGEPVVYGKDNVGISTATAKSAFQPIVTDIALNLGQTGGAANYRQFIYFTPSAEFRLSDFATSKQDIRNIDIRVWWKNRLDNQLYPLQMYNLSSVSIKVMFKHKDAPEGKAPTPQ